MPTIHGDSSAADWHAQTIASAEAYSQAEAEAAADARWNQNNQQTQVTSGTASYQTDGVDLPTTNQRALDAFLGPEAARGGTAVGGSTASSGTGTSGRTYLDPADAEQHRQLGFTVLTDEDGQAYLPSQVGYDLIQPPPWTVVPGPDHAGSTPATPSTAVSSAGSQTSSTPSTGAGAANPINEAGQSPEPDEIRSTFGEQVDALLNASPSLRAKWQQAKAEGWKIHMATGETKSNADSNTKTVWINPDHIGDKKNFAVNMAALLAHELGHAVTPYRGVYESEDRKTFVVVNTEWHLQHEGAAAFENARARDEIKAATGTDIGIRGGFDLTYTAIYDQYKAGAITEAQAKAQMTGVMASEPDRVNRDGSVSGKQQVAEEKYGAQWDERKAKKD